MKQNLKKLKYKSLAAGVVLGSLFLVGGWLGINHVFPLNTPQPLLAADFGVSYRFDWSMVDDTTLERKTYAIENPQLFEYLVIERIQTEDESQNRFYEMAFGKNNDQVKLPMAFRVKLKAPF